MNRRIFTPEEQQLLRQNPTVASCSARSLSFTPAFKQRAIREHQEEGKMPQEIFAAAGLLLSVIGRRTPNERIKDWLAIDRQQGINALLRDGRGKHSASGRKRKERFDLGTMTKDEQIAHLKARIAYTEAENDFLARTRGLKRMPPFEYHPGNDTH